MSRQRVHWLRWSQLAHNRIALSICLRLAFFVTCYRSGSSIFNVPLSFSLLHGIYSFSWRFSFSNTSVFVSGYKVGP